MVSSRLRIYSRRSFWSSWLCMAISKMQLMYRVLIYSFWQGGSYFHGKISFFRQKWSGGLKISIPRSLLPEKFDPPRSDLGGSFFSVTGPQYLSTEALFQVRIKRRHDKPFYSYHLSTIYASRPVVAKRVACCDAQHPNPPLLQQFQRTKKPPTKCQFFMWEWHCEVRSHKNCTMFSAPFGAT